MTASRLPSRSKRFALVEAINTSLAKKYHRQFVVRAQKNNHYFIIYEPSHLPHFKDISKTKYAGYRVGFYINPGPKFTEIGTQISFNEAAVKNFASNFNESQFSKTMNKILQISESGDIFIYWSSKQALKDSLSSGKKKIAAEDKDIWFRFKSVAEFKKNLKGYEIDDFAKDIGCNAPTSGKGKMPTNRGFNLTISTVIATADCERAAQYLFPLYRWMYDFPKVGRKIRVSDLRRAMTYHYKKSDRVFECGFKGCKVKGIENLDAAHIRADQRYGTDSVTNGVFLCHEHHLIQEGKPVAWQKKAIKLSAKKGTILE